jgi:hypothetical protein
LIAVGIVAVALFIGFQVLVSQTKKTSPEELVEFVDGDKKIEIFLCQPGKRGREIFGLSI